MPPTRSRLTKVDTAAPRRTAPLARSALEMLSGRVGERDTVTQYQMQVFDLLCTVALIGVVAQVVASVQAA